MRESEQVLDEDTAKLDRLHREWKLAGRRLTLAEKSALDGRHARRQELDPANHDTAECFCCCWTCDRWALG
jgi:hypothetical protein